MEMTGRLTANAVVATIANTDRKVVNFTIAINEGYHVKNTGEMKEFTTYIDCGYWIATGVAKLLTKGSLVTVTGRISPDAYIDRQGNAKATIRCHVDRIKVHHTVKQPLNAAELTEPLDDLPF